MSSSPYDKYFISRSENNRFMVTGEALLEVNHLIEMNLNAIQGYEIAINNTHDEHLRQYFEGIKTFHEVQNRKLSEIVIEYRGQPVAGGTVAGAVHRGWMKVKVAIAADNVEALLEACVFGEKELDAAFEKALSKSFMTDPLHEIVAELHEGQYENLSRLEEFARNYRKT